MGQFSRVRVKRMRARVDRSPVMCAAAVHALHGSELDLHTVPALGETWLRILSNYGRVWTTGGRTRLLEGRCVRQGSESA
jgi:hypothetical protein